jgi:nucleoside-diphosphate-sugar epimerase
MKNILIIGGNGYVGSRLYDFLIDLNYNVTNIDICWFGKTHSETIVDDYKNIKKEFLEKFSHIVLLAAHSGQNMCVDNFLDTFNNNVNNYINLIQILNSEQTLIYASTCAVYGNNNFPVTEDFIIKDVLNIYDYTKISREKIAKLFSDKKLIGLRFGSIGGFSKNFRYENLMNSLTVSTLKNQNMTISNGECVRSVLGMIDACRAIEAIIKNDFKGNKIYNVTSFNDKIINIGLKLKEITNSDIILNDHYKTEYSWDCLNSLFESEFDFKFEDTIESIYNDIILNYNEIMFNNKRERISYE